MYLVGRILLEGLQRLLANMRGYEVTASFTNGLDFLDFLQTSTVDIALLDVTLPDVNGIELCAQVKRKAPDTIVIGLSNHSERSLILQLLQNGASGYLLKNIDARELKASLKEALNGQITFSREVKEIIARPSLSELKQLPKLTQREKEILQLIASGETTVSIAGKLYLSPLTVETHRKRMMNKYAAKNTASLIKLALENNLI